MKKITETIAWICIAIGCAVFGIYIYGLCCNDYAVLGEIKDTDIERTGQIGDFFGGIIGSIWALAGVLLYFSALRMQSQELSNQMREMSDNKKLMQQQQFETTFFNLLKTQQDLKNSLKGQFHCIIRGRVGFEYHSETCESDAFFDRIYSEMNKLYVVYKQQKYVPWNEAEVKREIEDYAISIEYENDPEYDYEGEARHMYERYNRSYSTYIYAIKESTVKQAQQKPNEMLMCRCIYGHIFARYQNAIGHYCRHLYNIIKFLDNEKQKCLNEKGILLAERKAIDDRFSTYVAFIHSMLTTKELCVIFYNSLLFSKAKILFVKYNLFDNLLKENLLSKDHAELMERAILKTSKDIFHHIIEELDADDVNNKL